MKGFLTWLGLAIVVTVVIGTVKFIGCGNDVPVLSWFLEWIWACDF